MKVIPNTIEEAFEELDKLNSSWDKWFILEEDDAVSLSHHAVGQWIRNEWELWVGNGELKKWFLVNEIKHPDDMSAIILRSYHRLKNNKELNIEDQIEETVQYYLTDKEKLLRIRKRKINEINER